MSAGIHDDVARLVRSAYGRGVEQAPAPPAVDVSNALEGVDALEQTLTDTERDRDRYGDLLVRLSRHFGVARLSDQNSADDAARRLEQWLAVQEWVMRGAPSVMVAGRGAGKTTALARWLLEGHTITHGGWSRRVITADAVRADWTRRAVADLYRDHLGRLADSTNADQCAAVEHVQACVVHAEQASRTLLGVDHGVEVAVDDVEAVLPHALRVTHPVVAMTITGHRWPAPVEEMTSP